MMLFGSCLILSLLSGAVLGYPYQVAVFKDYGINPFEDAGRSPNFYNKVVRPWKDERPMDNRILKENKRMGPGGSNFEVGKK